MKKKISKALVVAMAAAMMSTVSVPVFAANTVITDGTWIGSDYVDAEHTGTASLTNHTITVTNVADTSEGLTVKAYQLVKGTYKDGKLTGYVLCDATNAAIANMEAPTVSEITTIANNIRANTTTLQGIQMTRGTGAASNQFTATVEAGLYVVLASGSDGYVYNPAIVAVNIDDANDIDDESSGNDGLDKNNVDATSVSLASYWEIPTRAYLKSSTTLFNKDVLGSEASPFVEAENTEGDITSKGALVSFKLDGMTIPTYTDEYAKPKAESAPGAGDGNDGVIYKIEDKLDGTAFAGISDMLVQTNVAGTKTTVAATVTDDNGTPDDATDDVTVTNYTIVYKDASGTVVTGADIATSATQYSIQFSDTWLRANAEKGVEVTYKARFTDEANVNGHANKTVATLSYTVDPDDNTGVEVLRDSTYHYTFEIGGAIDAGANGTTTGTVDGVASFEGYEINKVTEALGSGEHYTADATTGEFSSENALAGATFTLYDDAAFTTIHQNKVRNATTGVWETEDAVYTTQDDGHLVFSGLDVGTYYLKETNAPAGYTLNDNDYKVVIAGTISDGTTVEEGTLTGYSITTYVKNGANWDPCGSAVYAITPEVTKPSTDVTAMNFDTVVNATTTTVTEAEVVDTQLAALPATGGAGTIALTIGAAIGMGGFLTLYLVMKKKGKKEN